MDVPRMESESLQRTASVADMQQQRGPPSAAIPLEG